MRNSIYLLLAFCLTLACGCSSSDGPAAPTPTDDGPFVEITTDKATVSPGEQVAIQIRAGERKDGVVTYIENVEIYASMDDTEENTIEGFTDIDGVIAQTATYEGSDYSNGIFMEVRAEYPSGDEVEREHWIYRPNELKVMDQYTQVQAGVLFRTQGGATVGYRDYQLMESDEVGAYPADQSTTQSGSIGGMTSAASAIITGSLGVEAGPTAVQLRCDVEVEGEVSLENPVASGSYFAESSSEVELDIEFVVYGNEPATITITGNFDIAHYEIEFEGRTFTDDEDIDEVICERYEGATPAPCPQISITRNLEPGEYEMRIEMDDYRKFLDEGPTEGRATYMGSADMTITITQ